MSSGELVLELVIDELSFASCSYSSNWGIKTVEWTLKIR